MTPIEVFQRREKEINQKHNEGKLTDDGFKGFLEIAKMERELLEYRITPKEDITKRIGHIEKMHTYRSHARIDLTQSREAMSDERYAVAYDMILAKVDRLFEMERNAFANN